MEPQCLPQLSSAPRLAPGPAPPALAQDWAWKGARPQFISARPPEVCLDCQPHRDLAQGAGGSAIGPRLCPYELISRFPLPHQPAAGPRVRRTGGRRLRIGCRQEGRGLTGARAPPRPHGVGPRLLEPDRRPGRFPGRALGRISP